MKLILRIASSLLLSVNTGYGSVIQGSHILLQDGGHDSDYALTVFQDEAGTDYTSIWIDVSWLTLSLVTYNIDEGSDWFLTAMNDEFSEASINSNAFPILKKSGPPLQINDVHPEGVEFFLGVNTGQSYAEHNNDRDVYGWVKLRYTGIDSLELVDSAMAYEETGIYIGTTQAVPEPATALLFGIGILGAWISRRNKSNQAKT